MSLFEFFFPKKKAPHASIAKERLQIVLAHERASRDSPDFLPRLQKELFGVVAKYVAVRDDMISVSMRRAASATVLEINVEMPAPVKTMSARPVPA